MAITGYVGTSSAIGVDFNNTSTTQLFGLGTKMNGSQNSEWVYVQAATSVTAYKVVAINAAGTVGMASGADMSNGLQLGIAQTSFAASEFGWVPIRGEGLGVLTTGSCSVANAIYLAASSTPTGIVSISASASNTLAGIVLTTVSATANATVQICIATWPRGNAAGL